jgi:hypothetical protein
MGRHKAEAFSENPLTRQCKSRMFFKRMQNGELIRPILLNNNINVS